MPSINNTLASVKNCWDFIWLKLLKSKCLNSLELFGGRKLADLPLCQTICIWLRSISANMTGFSSINIAIICCRAPRRSEVIIIVIKVILDVADLFANKVNSIPVGLQLLTILIELLCKLFPVKRQLINLIATLLCDLKVLIKYSELILPQSVSGLQCISKSLISTHG